MDPGKRKEEPRHRPPGSSPRRDAPRRSSAPWPGQERRANGTPARDRDAGPGIGSAAGPIEVVIGGIADALGGWWAEETASKAIDDWPEHDAHYREHYAAKAREGVEYRDARVGYGIGHVAGRHPEYRGRTFDQVEPELRRHWRHERLDYDTMRPYVRTGYLRTSTAV